MIKFFRELSSRSPETVAKEYSKYLLNSCTGVRKDTHGNYISVINQDDLLDRAIFNSRKSRFSICLATDGGSAAFDDITKRVVLVSDTLMLTHHLSEGKLYDLGVCQEGISRKLTPFDMELMHGDRGSYSSVDCNGWYTPTRPSQEDRIRSANMRIQAVGMFCPDLETLGRWILAAEPILKAGLACYLPSYSLRTVEEKRNGRRQDVSSKLPHRAPAVDLLVRNRRAVEASGAQPLKSRLVRPVLSMDLPFIDGVSLRDFSKITVNEFASYSSFRDYLRLAYLELDEGMNAVQSQHELTKIGIQINQQVQAAQSAMKNACRKKALTVTGATISTVGVILVAVYGPALAAAVAAIGASGGVWGIINAVADNDIRTIKQDSWYYVWALSKTSNRTWT